MGAVSLLAQRDVRRRWQGLVPLVLVVSIAGGVMLTAVAGARRTASSYDRFVETSKAADVSVETQGPAAGLVRRLERLPEVAEISQTKFFIIVPDAFDVTTAISEQLVVPVASSDARFGTVIDVPRVVEGRAADPDAPLEVVVSEGVAARLDRKSVV